MFQSEEYAYQIADLLRDYEIPTHFGVDQGNDYTLDDEIEVIEDYLNEHLNFLVSIDYGMSKMVIIPKKYNWVLKIPFNGYWVDYYKDTDLEDNWVPFTNAKCESTDNYCQAELDFYRAAVRCGVGQWFAHTEYLTDIADTFIYIQEKVPTLASNCSVKNFGSSKLSQDFVNDKIDDSMIHFKSDRFTSWLALGADMYSPEQVEFLFGFFEVYPEAAQDIHDGNYGFRIDGTPVLIDFSGYNC